MDIEKIQAIADIFEKKGLSYLEISEGATRIRLRKEGGAKAQYITSENTSGAPISPATTIIDKKSEPAPENDASQKVLSPLAGVFYASPSPESEPFVKVGDRVKKGDVLCIVEAMKVMNELVSDYDGEIIEICAKNGQIVEYNQVLIKIKQ